MKKTQGVAAEISGRGFRDRPCRRRNVSGQRRAAPKKAAIFVRNELLHAPCTARRTDARRSAATGSAARTAHRSGILSRRTEEKIDPGSGAACVLAEIAKHRAPGRPLSGGERLSVGVGRKRPLGASSAPCAAHGCRRIYPTKPVRKDETKGTCRSTAGGRKRLPVGKGCVLSSAPSDSSIPVYRYTCQEGEVVFLNKSRGGFLLILNRRRENGRISGGQTGKVGACAAAFCFMRSFLRGAAPHRFQTFRSENRFVFQQTLSDLSLRGGHIFCARRGNLLTERDGIPERSTARAAQ